MKTVSKNIYVTFRIAGKHAWGNIEKEAPSHVFEYSDFLKDQHRHLFYFKITIPVNDLNRELEFFYISEKIQSLLFACFDRYKYFNMILFGNRSCEMIAEEFAAYLAANSIYVSEIEVSEDNENGAILKFEHENS